MSVASTYSVAFVGVEARVIEVQCSINSGLPTFQIVGLPNKSVSEAKERIRSALQVINLALPAKRITINLSPADIPKHGSHFDLPITLAILTAMEVLSNSQMNKIMSLGELSLDAKLIKVAGALPAAFTAMTIGQVLLCPLECGPEAAWVDQVKVIAADNLVQMVQYLVGKNTIEAATVKSIRISKSSKDLAEVKGQETAKRALEIAAAGRHHMLMIGPPGSGKSMMAARVPSIMPPMTAKETLEISMIHSIAGLLDQDGIMYARPFRDPHHTSSVAALIGGGMQAKPGEVALAHHGILFLDELPEFSSVLLEALRQPLEQGEVVIARAHSRIRYPCKFMLLAAANPCKCGYIEDPNRACSRAPQCSEHYLGKLSGPLIDRFDICVHTTDISADQYFSVGNNESSEKIASRVYEAYQRQQMRYNKMDGVSANAHVSGKLMDETFSLSTPARALLKNAANMLSISSRGLVKTIRISRTIADLEADDIIKEHHMAEAIGLRDIRLIK